MNRETLTKAYGIVYVNGHFRRAGNPERWISVDSHYRSAPGFGPSARRLARYLYLRYMGYQNPQYRERSAWVATVDKYTRGRA